MNKIAYKRLESQPKSSASGDSDPRSANFGVLIFSKITILF